MLKDIPGKLLDRLQVQNSRQSRLKKKNRDIDSHTVITLIQRGETLRNKYLRYTLQSLLGYITHAHTQSSLPMYAGTLQQVHHNGGRRGRELWNEKSSLAGIDGTKITHADYCMYAYVLSMNACVRACVESNSLIVALWESFPPTPNRVGSVWLSR